MDSNDIFAAFTEDNPPTIQDVVNRWMLENGISVAQFSRMTSVAPQKVRRFLDGKMKRMDTQFVIAISYLTGISFVRLSQLFAYHLPVSTIKDLQDVQRRRDDILEAKKPTNLRKIQRIKNEIVTVESKLYDLKRQLIQLQEEARTGTPAFLPTTPRGA